MRTLLVVVSFAAFVGAQTRVDPKLPHYPRAQGVTGSIKSVGSDTMNNLMAGWTAGFRRFYPNVKIEIEGKGSGTAPTALIEGTASFGPMSRPMKPTEQDAFEERFGYRATQLPTAIDMLAFYVHKDNPIAKRGLTFAELDAIFSKTRFLGHGEIKTWGDLGLTGEWKAQPISLYGRSAASGTYSYLKQKALGDGDFKTKVKELTGSSSVVLGVANDRYAIGYSGIAYKTEDVAVVPLSRAGGPKILPEEKNWESYPLTRLLLIAVNFSPNGRLDPLRREFVRYLFCREGQEVVASEGFLPLPEERARQAARRVAVELPKARDPEKPKRR